MSPFRKGLVQILNALPAIILVTFVEVIVMFATAFLAMTLLMPILGQQHPRIVLGTSIMVAVATQAWIIFNHKIRAYIKARSTE
jgi:hypothetical protein